MSFSDCPIFSHLILSCHTKPLTRATPALLCCVVQTPALQHYSGYTESSLRACAVELHGVLSAAPASQLQAVRKKYATAKANFVSTLALPTL